MSAGAAIQTGATAGIGTKPPLDDVMLAMDVVDTLRRRERIVKTELDEAGREDDFKERLRKIYAAQGMEVPDHVIAQGVAALKEDRFTYQAPAGFLRDPARPGLYQARPLGQVGRRILGAPNPGQWHQLFRLRGPPDACPTQGTGPGPYRQVTGLAKTDAGPAPTRIRYFDAGTGGPAQRGQGGQAGPAAPGGPAPDPGPGVHGCGSSTGPGSAPGSSVFPTSTAAARNYYIVVEAAGPRAGNPVKVPIENEETGKTEIVTKWGLRVDEDASTTPSDATRRTTASSSAIVSGTRPGVSCCRAMR